MANDPWAEFRRSAPADPWAAFRASPPPPAEPVAAPPAVSEDPIRAEVLGEIEQQRANGLERPSGTARQWLQGATFGLADEALALGNTPVQMLKRGTLDPFKAYAYAKAREDLELEAGRRNNGMLGTAMEVAGNVGAGAKLIGAGVSAIPSMTAKLGSVGGAAAGAAIDGAALGALSGAAESSGFDRVPEAVTGGLIGGALGAALPLGGAALKTVAAPVISNVAARLNPAGYAERQVARAASRSGQTPEQIADRLGQAATEGQAEYRLLDALDYPGARLGAVVAKNPGQGRTDLRDFLNARQEGQGYRIGNALAEGLDAPETAQAAAKRMTDARRAMDNQAFGAVRNDAEAVNVSPVLSKIDETLRPGLTGDLNLQNGIAYDSVESVLDRARRLLSDGKSQITDFTVAQRARGDIADAVERAHRAGEGNKARLLRQVRDALDTELESASPGFRKAMANSRMAAREVDAVDIGKTAAGRGRTEDKIRAFSGLTGGEQAAFRAGYADPLIARVQGAAEGANKARPFTSQAMKTELPVFAAEGRGDTLMRQLGRENEMFANRAEALGNSKTAENLADNADAGIDAGLFAKLVTGHWGGALKDAVSRGAAGINGNTEAVRDNLARLLMSGDRDAALNLLRRFGQIDAGRAQVLAQANRGLLSAAIPTIERARIEHPQSGRR